MSASERCGATGGCGSRGDAVDVARQQDEENHFMLLLSLAIREWTAHAWGLGRQVSVMWNVECSFWQPNTR